MSTMTAPVTDQPRETPIGTHVARRGRTGICGHPLWGEPGGLPCIQPPGHYPASGHVYHDPTGSEIDAEPPSADHS